MNLAAIDVRKEVTADEDEHDSAEREHENGDGAGLQSTGQQYMQQIDVAGAQPLETLLEAAVEAGEPAGPAPPRHGARP